MKQKRVILCELCSDDTLAQTVVHWGLCGDHAARIVKEVKVKKHVAPAVKTKKTVKLKYGCMKCSARFRTEQGRNHHHTVKHNRKGK